jgi:hypothetical protein
MCSLRFLAGWSTPRCRFALANRFLCGVCARAGGDEMSPSTGLILSFCVPLQGCGYPRQTPGRGRPPALPFVNVLLFSGGSSAAHARSTGQELAFGDLPHEVAIGVEKIEAGKIASMCPADLLEDLVLQFAFKLLDTIKMQFDGSAFAIVML